MTRPNRFGRPEFGFCYGLCAARVPGNLNGTPGDRDAGARTQARGPGHRDGRKEASFNDLAEFRWIHGPLSRAQDSYRRRGNCIFNLANVELNRRLLSLPGGSQPRAERTT